MDLDLGQLCPNCYSTRLKRDQTYLNFAKAYNKVDYGILIHKLKAFGIEGKIGRWILCFLIRRKQQGEKIKYLYSDIWSASVDDSRTKQKVSNPEDVKIHQENLN